MTKAYIDISAGGRSFILDLRTEQLYLEKIERVKITNQQWQLLLYLINQSPRLISKAELHSNLWKNAPITDEAISQAVRNIRFVLRDQHAKSFIQTEHGRGYRFIGIIKRDEENFLSFTPSEYLDDIKSNSYNRLDNTVLNEEKIYERNFLVNQRQASLISDAILKWSGSFDEKIINKLNEANIQIGNISSLIDRFFIDVGYGIVEKENLAARFKEVADLYINYEKSQGNPPVSDLRDIISGVHAYEKVVILMKGKGADGKPLWSYLQLTLESLQRLKDAVVANNNFLREHFGKVLAFGVGDIPFEVEEEMRILHNMIPLPKPRA